jgi:hypothetical protein
MTIQLDEDGIRLGIDLTAHVIGVWFDASPATLFSPVRIALGPLTIGAG